MFIDSIKLNKNAWYSKLMKYTWGIKSDNFSHLCPFFWISLLNIVIFPFIFIFKSIFAAFIIKCFDKLDDYMSKKQEQEYKELTEMLALIKSTPRLQEEYSKKYAIYKDNGYNEKYIKCYSKLDREIMDRIFYNNRYEDYINKQMLDSKFNEYIASKPVKKESKPIINPNKQLIVKLNKIAKPIGQFLLLVISLIALYIIGYYGYKFIIFLSHVKFDFNMNKFLNGLKLIGFILLCVAVILLIAYYINKLIENTKFCCHLVKVLNIIAKPFIWIGIGFYKIGVILFQMLKNNCPAIKWND